MMMEADYKKRPTAEALLNIPCLKRVQRYKTITNVLTTQVRGTDIS